MNISLIADNIDLKGRLNEVNVNAVYATSVFGQKPKIYRLDNSSGNMQVVDATTAATNVAANSFNPFSGSVLPAVASLKVYKSTDGAWASSAVTPSAGSLASFQSTGWKLITFPLASDAVAWRPSNSPSLNMPSLKYFLFELDDAGWKDSFLVADEDDDVVGIAFKADTAGSTSIAPLISDVRLVRHAAAFRYFDLTTRSQGDPSVLYTPSADTWMPLPGGKIIYGFNEIPYSFIEYVMRKNGSGTTYKLYATGAGSTLIDITSQFTATSNFRQNGPATGTTAAEHFESIFPSVAGFTKRSIGTIPIEFGTTLVTPAMYYIVEEIDTATSAPQQVSIYRLRSRQYGTANVAGITVQTQKTIRAVVMHMKGLKTGTGDRALTFVNLSTGVGRDSTIPSATVQGDFVRLDFDDLTIEAGQVFGILLGASGGAAYADVDVFIEGLN